MNYKNVKIFKHNIRDLYQYFFTEIFVLKSHLFPNLSCTIFKYEIPNINITRHKDLGDGLEINANNLFTVDSYLKVFKNDNIFKLISNSHIFDRYIETPAIRFSTIKPIFYIFKKPSNNSYEESIDIHLDFLNNFFKEGNNMRMRLGIDSFEEDNNMFIKITNLSF